MSGKITLRSRRTNVGVLVEVVSEVNGLQRVLGDHHYRLVRTDGDLADTYNLGMFMHQGLQYRLLAKGPYSLNAAEVFGVDELRQLASEVLKTM